MVNRWYGATAQLARFGALAGALLACSNDAGCILYPCPLPEAARLSVTAPNAPAGIPGLVASITGRVTGAEPCDEGPVNICRVMGGTGTYHVQVSAPGYKSVQLDLTITGSDAGCNTCGHVDRQDLAVLLEPAS